MKSIPYFIVDVFAKSKYGGNQLAVFIDLDQQLDSAEMLAMAKEINFAETTFIRKKRSSKQYEVRIFTPESEIPFAGHPTIGTSYIIAKYLLEMPLDTIILSVKKGDIKVEISQPKNIDASLFTMTQVQPEFLKSFPAARITEALGLEAAIIDTSLPIQEISTGLPFIIIPVKGLAALSKIELNFASFQSFLINNECYKTNSSSKLSTSLFFFSKETFEIDNDYAARMFCLEDHLLKEDAATGSANGCFLAYLLRYSNVDIQAKVEQGFQMGRKSYLFLDGAYSNNHYSLRVGGYTKMIAEGKWYI